MEKKGVNPTFRAQDAQRFAVELYGIDGTVKNLVSDTDQNFLITNPQTNESYVLKIANVKRAKNLLDAQNRAMEYVAQQFPADDKSNDQKLFARVIPTLQAEQIAVIKDSNDTEHFARMVTYIPGTLWANLDRHSTQLLENLGQFLGSLDKTLEPFHHPALHRYTKWDLKNAADLETYAGKITDLKKRRLVTYFLQQFKTFAVPMFPKLRTGVIHNDANDYNILVDEKGTRVTGIIDFGDMIHTCIVNELAIAIAYAIHGKEDPVETAAIITKSYHSVYPLTEPELDVLFHLICARLCTTILMSAHQITLEPENEYLSISVAPAWEALEKLITISPPIACDTFRKACGFAPRSHGRSPEEILKIRERHLGKMLSVSYKKPLKIVRGAMQYLYDHNGRAYLDTVNNVCHVGHCHPAVVKAAQEQIAVLNTNTRYLHDNIAEYAQQLTAALPEPLSVCFIVCTGSEANELALRMARVHTRHTDFAVVDHAYHGNTNAVIEISAYKFDGPGGKGCPSHVHKALMPDVYRGPYKKDHPNPGETYALDVQRAIKEAEAKGKKIAAFIHESVLGVAGQVVLPGNYLKNAYRYARQAGAVCIADEVQVGFGRVGTHMWGFQTQDVVPDIVTMGKPIGNGHPLAAVVTTPEIAESFNNGMEYFNTFGGNPVSCAVGKAVLDVIQSEKLQENSLKVGNHFKSRLETLKEKYPIIGDVRGLGLFIGIELVRDRQTLEPADKEAYEIAEKMKDQGILISVDGPLYNVLKIKPPIIFTQSNADQYVDTLGKILKD